MYIKVILNVSRITGGSLVDCLHTDIEPETVLKITYQATQSVKHLHMQSIPITHRDIKVEFEFELCKKNI